MFVIGVIEIVAGVAVALALARLATKYAPARYGALCTTPINAPATLSHRR